MKYKSLAIALIIVAGCLLSVGCHKTCHCYAYDGSHKYFTPEEVEAQGTTCPNMVYFGTTKLYSLCEWDY